MMEINPSIWQLNMTTLRMFNKYQNIYDNLFLCIIMLILGQYVFHAYKIIALWLSDYSFIAVISLLQCACMRVHAVLLNFWSKQMLRL